MRYAHSHAADQYSRECHRAIQQAGLQGGQQIFQQHDLTPPRGETENSTLARMLDPDVWERKLRCRNQQRQEKRLRDAGVIHRHAQAYCSNRSVEDFVEAQKDSQAYLKRQIALSSDGDEVSLADIAQATVANPFNRRHEMMTRMRGIETIAQSMGMMCLFLTFTAPSKYHRKRLIKGRNSNGSRNPAKDTFINNPHYQALIDKKPNTPQLSHIFIKRVVGRAIAKFKRQALDYTGYKVVEPHHDGTVHWHMAFFVQPDNKDHAIQIFTHYALQEDSSDKGAKQYRLVIKDHDPQRGSVTGYMAKYISKGIAGFGIGTDDETGIDCDQSVIRILAWKSIWGIRQFAFYGSPSVTVWRELRRLREPLSNPLAEQFRLAADGGHWDLFIKQMQQYPMRLLKTALLDAEGVEKKNKYGEVVKRVAGLAIQALSGVEIIRTRFKEWFLVDLEKLERRIIRGLPFEARNNPTYLNRIRTLLSEAQQSKKILCLHHATRGVVPFDQYIFADFSAAPPLGLVGNNVTVEVEEENQNSKK